MCLKASKEWVLLGCIGAQIKPFPIQELLNAINFGKSAFMPAIRAEAKALTKSKELNV